MKYLFCFLSILTLFVSSCSSDACEEITCVRGSCDDGTCLCPLGFGGDDCSTCAEGFYGANCDITDFNGSYWLTGLSFTGCDDYPPGYSKSSTVEERELCVTEIDENIFCWHVNLIISKTPQTFRWVGGADWTLDGGASWREWSIIDRIGNYRVDGEKLILTSDDNREYEFIIMDNQLTRNYQKNRFIEDCFWMETFTKKSN